MRWGLVRHVRRGRGRGRLRGAAALLAVCSSLAGCWWTQPGAGPEQTRHNPFEKGLTADNVAGLTEQWSVQVEGWATPPVTSGSLLYTTRSHPSALSVLALDIESGDLVWERTLSAFTNPIAATLVGDELWVSHAARSPFVNALCADIVRLDRKTGEVAGTTATELPATTFTAAGSIVAYVDTAMCQYGTGTRPRLVVRDRRTADLLWTAVLDGAASFGVIHPPIVSGGRILARGPWPGTAVFDADGCGASECDPVASLPTGDVAMASGGRAFAFRTDAINPAPPFPPLRAGIVQVFSMDTGEELWRAEYGTLYGDVGGGVDGIAVRNDKLYVSGYTFGTPSTDEQTLDVYPVAGCGEPACAPAWTSRGDPLAGETAVAGDVVYMIAPDTIRAYDADGCGAPTCAPLATVPVTAEGTHDLIVSAGHVFLVTPSANVATDGSTITAYGLP